MVDGSGHKRHSDQAALVITIRRQGETAFFDIADVEPLIQNIQLRLDDAAIKRLNASMASLTAQLDTFLQTPQSNSQTGKDFDEILAKYKRLGQFLFEQFFPDPVRRYLSVKEICDVFLRLEESLVDVPWELAFDGREFLSKSHRIGRQVITSLPFNRPTKDQAQIRESSKMLVICDPTESLPAAIEETEALVDSLDRNTRFQVEVIGGKRCSKIDVLSALSEFDLVHFAGHSIYKPGDSQRTGWLLHDSVLNIDEVGKLLNPPVLVFSNSCESAASSNSNCTRQADLGIGGSFLLAGVQHFIGALWVVHDRASAELAAEFYRNLATGVSIGQALHLAKAHNPQIQDLGNLLGLGYVHYGRPDDRIVSSRANSQSRREQAIQSTIGNRSEISHTIRKRLPAGLVCGSLIILLLLLAHSLFQNAQINKSQGQLLREYRTAVESYEQGNIAASIARFNELMGRKDNRSRLGRADLAEIHLEAGAKDKAEEILRGALTAPVRNAKTLLIKGDLCFLQRDLTGAEDAYQAAINTGIGLPEQMAEAYNALGIVNFINGNRDAAVTLFDEAQSTDSRNADALYNLAFAAYMNHSVKQAKAFLQETMDHHPEDELAALLLNMILAESSATDKLEKSSDHRRIMIGPIFPAYTGTKRLGYDWILASALRQRFITENTNNNFDVSVLNCYRSEMDPSCLSKAFFPKHNILDYLRSQQADLALIGHLHLYRHVIYGHIKAVETDSGTILLQKELKSEGKNKIHYMLEQLNAVLAEAISSK